MRLTRPTSSDRWAGADTSDASQFYWNDDVIKIFKGYISVLLNHVNTYTGVRPPLVVVEGCRECARLTLSLGPLRRSRSRTTRPSWVRLSLA